MKILIFLTKTIVTILVCSILGYTFHFFVFNNLSVFAEDVSTQSVETTISNSVTDTDHDGLIDPLEQAYGTDPSNPDTDSDGYTDGLETLAGYNPFGQGKLKTAPLPVLAQQDLDGDGIFNILETITSTDYRKADTDSDGLTDSIEIEHGLDPLKKDTDADGHDDGAELFSGYNPKGPGLLTSNTFATMSTDYSTGNTTSPVNNSSSIPIVKQDTDKDGILDNDEKILGTDPTKKDTDGDGVSDYEELVKHTNPLKK